MEAEPLHPAVEDMVARIELGLARGGSLLTEEESGTIRGLLQVQGAEALVVARLAARETAAWRAPDLAIAGVDQLHEAVDSLRARGILTDHVPWPLRASLARRETLADGCRRLGLCAAGPRPVLVARLVDRVDWDDAPWVMLAVGPLLLRLERWATLRVRPDPSVEVLQRIGRLRWAPYRCTGEGSIVPSRADWLAWERLVESMPSLDDVALFSALDIPVWPPGDLDLRRELVARLADRARELARAGQVGEAGVVWSGLCERGWHQRGEAWAHLARALERDGRGAEGLARLSDARRTLDGLALHAVDRAGRALARRIGRSWAPEPPLHSPPERTLTLHPAGRGVRPEWRVDGVEATIEESVCRLLAGRGRRAIHAEGWLWSTVIGLLLADLYFLPIPGQLPVPFLAGPLDLGTREFAERRRPDVDRVREAVAAGGAGELVAAAWERWQGTVLEGVAWGAGLSDVLAAAQQASAGLLRALLDAVLEGGFGALAGLPDLVVLAGEEVQLPEAWPGRLGVGLFFAEVKGPGDAVREAQAVWFHRLLGAGARVELWRVRPSPNVHAAAGGAGPPAPGSPSATGGVDEVRPAASPG